MKKDNINIIHFHNGTGGGVLSVIRGLLLFQQHPGIKQHVIYTIHESKRHQFKLPGLSGAATEKCFYYSGNWNFYYICRQLARLLPDEKAVIIAHDWLELGMVSHLGLANPVVQVLHGDYPYYYELAKKHAAHVAHFIGITQSIADELKKRLPDQKDDIVYLRFPVRDPQSKNCIGTGKKIIFIGRCEEAKGFHILPEIEKALRQMGSQMEWTIIGDGELLAQMKWPAESSIRFLKEIPNDEVLQEVALHDFIILPSLAEGMPVAVIEAMKAGVIPLVNDIPGGVQELVENRITGYKISHNDPYAYAVRLHELATDLQSMKNLSMNAKARGQLLFDPVTTTMAFENLFIQAGTCSGIKDKRKIYGSRLDAPWMPNQIVHNLREIIAFFNEVRSKLFG